MDQIKELRARTGSGMVDVKQALEEAKGDMEQAILILRKKGKASAAKKAGRETHEGYIGTYMHSNNKIGVMVSLLCETDFVARSDRFQELAKNIAMHIAAADPQVINPDDVPVELVEVERGLATEAAAGKPEEIQLKIIDGKLKRFREEQALLTQAYIKDPNRTIADLIHEAVGELGENISIGDFKRIAI